MKRSDATRWILRQTKRYLPTIFIMSLCSALSSFSLIALALLSRALIDTATGDATGNFGLYCYLLFGVIALQVALNIAHSALRLRAEGKLQIALKTRLFKQMTTKKYRSFSQYHSGDLLNRFTSDVDIVVSGVTTLIPGTVSLFTKLIAGVVTLLALSPFYAILVLAIGLIFPILGRLISRPYKHLHKEMVQAQGVVRSFLQECFQNIVLVKSFPSRQPVDDRLARDMKTHYRLKLKRGAISIASSAGLYLLFTLGYYVTMVWGAKGIATGALSYGTLMAFLQIIAQLRAPMQNVSNLVPQFYSTTASAERLMELEQLSEEPERLPDDRLQALIESFSGISAEHLSFSYSKKRAVIIDSTFFVRRGTLTAITGLSGAGKSTLFRLLLGLYEPDAGSLSVECGGKKLATNATIRGLFAYVPQGNMILSGTIRDNIAFCNPTASEARIRQAVETAVMAEFVDRLPQGLDTMLGERGIGLSEGQIQRIAIARALVSDAPVLLLDECTSALDNKTETALLENLLALKDRTVLFISHRAYTIAECEAELHLENGHFTLNSSADASLDV